DSERRGGGSMSHRSRRRIVIWTLSLLAVVLAGRANAPIAGVLATDPGPRGGSPAAGGPLSGLMPKGLDLFHAAQESIQKIRSVTGSVPDTGFGLAPRFNMDSCVRCPD